MADVAEILREGVEALNARDMDRLVAVFHPDVEIASATAALSGSKAHGHAGLLAWQRDLDETWSEMTVEAEAFFERGDTILVHVMLRARGRLSDVEVVTPIAYIVTIRDGLIFTLNTYTDRQVALDEFGSLEDVTEVPPD